MNDQDQYLIATPNKAGYYGVLPVNKIEGYDKGIFGDNQADPEAALRRIY